MFWHDDGQGAVTMLKTTIKAALAIGGLSLLATNWLSTSTLDRSSLGQLAGRVSGSVPEPTMTGSLRSSAQSTKLDPCASPARR